MTEPSRLFPARVVLFALVVVVCDQARLEPDRWWRSSRDVALLGLTPEQSMAVERVYEDGLIARNRAGEEVIYLDEQLKYLRQWNGSDEELRRLTRELANARAAECELFRQMLQRISEPLSARQREELARLVRQQRVMESTCLAVNDPSGPTSAQSDPMRRER
jgi:hypothetical protein